MRGIILLSGLAAATTQAATLYDNTTSDQGFSVFYSASGYTQIGDRLHLLCPGFLNSIETQFFNGGVDATFDATLTLYEAGSPVGNPPRTFTVTGIFIACGESQTVAFTGLGGLFAPASLVGMLSIQNVSTDGDSGVNLFGPPTIGTSDETFFLADEGIGIAVASTFTDLDNLYFRVNGDPASTIPEPRTALLVGLGAGMVFLCRRQAARKG